MILLSEEATMEIQSYQNQAELLLKEYLLADSFIPYTSVICGIFACKMVYDLTQLFSSVYFKSYLILSKVQRNEWNNRSISTVHASFITVMSLYFVFWSNLYSDNRYAGMIMFRSSALSTFTLGVSVGYFLADIGMIIWFYSSLGGIEYVIHHFLSLTAVAYSMMTGEGQLYTFMVLISETTTPGINLRWYLDTAGMKRSRAYLINGVVIFVTWLVARILLFMYLFYHVYLHFDQLWATVNIRRAFYPISYELNVVWKDYQGIKENISKEAMKGILFHPLCCSVNGSKGYRTVELSWFLIQCEKSPCNAEGWLT
ncbi:hypothetical protein Godav_014765 [Gossypium davidsonii]|uniref:TLC domain-containing protein n=2 Tax=Gossypium TaxID=3633 RepID=A0A7J8RLQ4_GOSDV|nr:hypothetical protein [Gossypium davidsonii]MBA0649712.1 hypothetical protein [Gossypium klotzschianum]